MIKRSRFIEMIFAKHVCWILLTSAKRKPCIQLDTSLDDKSARNVSLISFIFLSATDTEYLHIVCTFKQPFYIHSFKNRILGFIQ